MYKVLLATDSDKVRETFTAAVNWESLGYKNPKIVGSAEEAIERLRTKRTDAIAFCFSEGNQQMMQQMMQEFPVMPIMDTPDTVDTLVAQAKRLARLLDVLNADYSNDNIDKAGMLQIARHDFLRELMAGKVTDRAVLRGRLLNVRSVMDPSRPCMVVDLHLPEGSDFLTGRWHYGPERLQVALRNFFGAEMDGMRMLVSVMPDANARLLCCPIIGRDVDFNGMADAVTKHAVQAIADVKQYLGLNVELKEVHALDSLMSIMPD